MEKPYRLEELTTQEVARWDELIAPYEAREVFHRRAWLDYLADTRGVRLRFWKIEDDIEGTVGVFCGGIARKGPYRILGSPLRGWSTNFMGPLMNRGADQCRFIAALDCLAKQENLAVVELEYPAQPDDVLEKAQYESSVSWTYWVELSGGQDAMLARMDKARRYGIRRAIKGGLIVEQADERIVDEYCDLFSDVMLRKGLAVPYPKSYARVMYEKLSQPDFLFSVRVKDGDGRVLAAGLFPHDDKAMYFWGGASSVEGKRLYASDLLHWHAMTLAAKKGLVRYDLSGWGRFKKEFGGQFITLKRWHKSYSRTARWARRGYEFYFRRRARLNDWFTNVRARGSERGEAQQD